MALVDLWKSSPEQIRGKTVQQLLGFAGDGKLRDGKATSAEFREFLGHVPSDFLAEFANQCLESPFQDSGLALQDVINQVGKRLSFQIEHGRYRGTAGEVGFDGNTEVGDYHTHGEYSKAVGNTPFTFLNDFLQNFQLGYTAVATFSPLEDSFDSDNFSKGDKIDAEEEALERPSSTTGEVFKSYLGTPSGKFKKYTTNGSGNGPVTDL
jgi:hypothetical protein